MKRRSSFWAMALGVVFFLVRCESVERKVDRGEAISSEVVLLASASHQLQKRPCGCSWYPLGGMKRLEKLVARQRERGISANVKLFSVGNQFVNRQSGMGNELASPSQWVEAWNRMRATAILPGPEDFSIGLKPLRQLEKRANFAFVTSNVFYRETRNTVFTPRVEQLWGNDRVWIMGLTSPQTPEGFPSQLSVQDPVKVIKEMIVQVGAAVPDLIIVLSTLSDSELSELFQAVKTPLIVFGSKDDVENSFSDQPAGHVLSFEPAGLGKVVAEVRLHLGENWSSFFNPDVSFYSLQSKKALVAEAMSLAVRDLSFYLAKGKSRLSEIEKQLLRLRSIPTRADVTTTQYHFQLHSLDKRFD